MATGREFKQYTSAIPMEGALVTLIDFDSDTFAVTLAEKVAMLRGADSELVAVWQGKYESHAFKVDADRALTDIIERAQQGRSAR